MTTFKPTPALDRAASISGSVATASAEVAAECAKKPQFIRDRDAKKGERDRLRELEDRDRAVRLIDGNAAAPAKISRTRKISRLDDEISALTAALPLQDERVAAKEQALRDARQPYEAAMLDVLADLQTPALASIQETLASLTEALVDLLASDIVRMRTIGDEYAAARDGPTIVSGSITVRKMISGLPVRFRPSAYDFDKLYQAATSRASQITNYIMEKSQ